MRDQVFIIDCFRYCVKNEDLTPLFVLIAWLALEKNPADLEKEFIAHYNQVWINKINGNQKSTPIAG
jgi:hypothetical protein